MFGDAFKACRVESWFGWLFNFGLGSFLFELPPFERAVIVFFAFSLATASIFVLNQYFDREADRENNAKSTLPVASGRITPRRALILSLTLVILCFILVFVVDFHLLPLFLVYLGLCTAYSAPPLRLKTVPIVDFAVSGIGAGLLPFLIGLGVPHQLNISVSFIVLCAMPLVLFHSGGHIIQAVGDYEADRKTGVHTFVVRYGRKKGVLVAGFMFLTAALLPFTYSAFGLLSPGHLLLFFILLPLFIPVAMRYANVLKNPSTTSVIDLHKTARKHGIIALAILWAYILLIKITGF
ncbi:MAG: UbiA prenyltransferase family protein [Aigarchaeota archaeon]|nr:UbiA prenyltransferase family protein [Aigarchaeota archaeon]